MSAPSLSTVNETVTSTGAVFARLGRALDDSARLLVDAGVPDPLVEEMMRALLWGWVEQRFGAES